MRIVRVVLVADEMFLIPVISIQPTAPGSNPQHTALVYDQMSNPIVTQAVGVLRVIAIHFDAGAVIPVQSTSRAYPYKSVFILSNSQCLII